MYERNIFVLHIYMKRKFYDNRTNSLEEKKIEQISLLFQEQQKYNKIKFI